jgi:hypothetical protein
VTHYVVFDIETRKMADEVEGGFDGLKKGLGGISAIAVYDSLRGRTFLYDDHSLESCAAHMEKADVVVGFNSHSFDASAIEGILGRKLRLKCHLDLLTMIWDSLRKRGVHQFKGNKLHDVGLRTIGRGKTGSGAHAPQLAKDGRWAELFQYCADDTELTKDLFEHALTKGGVIDVNGNFLPLSFPSWVRLKDDADAVPASAS